VKISQIIIQPIGQRFNAGTLSIKTYKKTWQVGEIWWSQVILMDETGEIPADVNVGKKYNPIRGRGNTINAIVCEVQDAEYLGKDRKKLVIDQYSIPTMMRNEYEKRQEEIYEGEIRIIRGKIKTWIISEWSNGRTIDEVLEFSTDPNLDLIVDNIMGE